MHQGRGHGRLRRGSAVLAVSALALLAMGAYGGNGRHVESAGGEVEPSWAPDGAATELGGLASAVSAAIGARLAEAPGGVRPDRWARVQRLYEGAGGAPLWLGEGG